MASHSGRTIQVAKTLTLSLGLVAGAVGCTSTVEAPSADRVQIVLAVGGGFAGVDWQVTIDGETNRVIGDRCRANLGCDWEAGQVLADIETDDVRALVDEFVEQGFFAGDSEFGSECCDQFDYQLSFVDRDVERTVTGSDGLLPANIHELISVVSAFVHDSRS
jgi:hypothetical protein